MSKAITPERVLEALSKVNDPELHKDLVTLNMIKQLQVEGGNIRFQVELTTPACPLKDVIRRSCEEALKPLEAESVTISFGARVRQTTAPEAGSQGLPMLEKVKNVILVASGKGGVGKSTVAANLAVALAAEGARVGLLDADIYGPSIPIMFGIQERPSSPDGKHIHPVRAHGIDLMSIGFFVAPEQAMIWRGPILNSTITQFLRDVIWDEQDYLIVDLPPGTGDVQLSISQQLKVTGAVLVTTPQDVALADVVRAKTMFDQVKIPILGVVENMSYFICSTCATRHEIFSSGGGRQAADKLGLPFLGDLPLVPAVREAGDAGAPVVARDPDSAVSEAFRQVTRAMAARVSMKAMGEEGRKRKLFTKIFG